MLPQKSYSGKLILFGEYTVLLGGGVLAVPYPTYQAQWKLSTDVDNRLLDFLGYLANNQQQNIDQAKLMALIDLVNQGWMLESTIPIGSGLGSSGSVVAAVFDAVGSDIKLSLLELKSLLAQMEGYFHGKSSGIDPLVSFINQAVYCKSDLVEATEINSLPTFELVDSKVLRVSSTLVTWFQDEYQNRPSFRRVVEKIGETNEALIALLKSAGRESRYEFREEFQDKARQLSYLHFDYLPQLIPPTIAELWHEDLQSGKAAWKLCGAGGGGYFIKFPLKP